MELDPNCLDSWPTDYPIDRLPAKALDSIADFSLPCTSCIVVFMCSREESDMCQERKNYFSSRLQRE